MRVVVAFMVLTLLAILLTQSVVAGAQATGKVAIAVTVSSSRQTEMTRADVLVLWNRKVTGAPIGHGAQVCIKAGSGDLRGGGIMTCNLTLDLPLGKVTATGIVHSLFRYTLVITGGTGEYLGVAGPLTVYRVEHGRRLVFTV